MNPLLGLFLVVPAAFAISWAIYRLLLTPLVRRAPNRDALEVDSILATFGMLFVLQGVMLVMFGGAYYSYSFLAFPVTIAGATGLWLRTGPGSARPAVVSAGGNVRLFFKDGSLSEKIAGVSFCGSGSRPCANAARCAAMMARTRQVSCRPLRTTATRRIR